MCLNQKVLEAIGAKLWHSDGVQWRCGRLLRNISRSSRWLLGSLGGLSKQVSSMGFGV